MLTAARAPVAAIASRCPWCYRHASRAGTSGAPHGSASDFSSRRRFQSTSATQSSPRLRFAPSPTGDLHLGGLRTALFNHLYARKHDGQWILRVEDTDRKRFVEGSAFALQQNLRWASLNPDASPENGQMSFLGPLIQSERSGYYRDAIDKLLGEGHAYRDFRSIEEREDERNLAQEGFKNARMVRREEYIAPAEEEAARLIESGRPFVVRLRMRQQTRTHADLVYGSLTFNKDESAEDPILLKSDGLPTYHLANVVDDSLMGITHVLRGEEWIPSLPIHLQLYEALGREPPQFAHLPLLVNPDGTKLSKRSGNAANVEDYIDQGYEPEALINYVALLGCNWKGNEQGEPADSSEVMTMQELISRFELERVTHSRAALDLAKLAFLNRKHVQLKVDAILPRAAPARSKGKRGTPATSLNAEPSARERGVDPEAAEGMLESLRWGLEDRYNIRLPHMDFKELARMVRLFGEKSTFVHDVVDQAGVLFELPDLSPQSIIDVVGPHSYLHVLAIATSQLQHAPLSSVNSAKDALQIIIEKSMRRAGRPASASGEPDLNKRTVNLAMRHALTGVLSGAALADLCVCIGQHELLTRLERASRAMREHLEGSDDASASQQGETELDRRLRLCTQRYAKAIADADTPHERMRLENLEYREKFQLEEHDRYRRLRRMDVQSTARQKEMGIRVASPR
ncbi:glutamyl-tRNA synthetase [Ceraceosorus guamensis]|uniref:glutamate--tRNA ligase n=1 Tax=Ceraceosorus guamensis TaxID=1522189 RepID=A0A316W337_9BASI|nr:glutamyl-tRNA synthetase [Ceraceosorus guamensis]PWN42075.1 glutamyl-tRNA synthetase [Ceraceosorus guamensis]